MPSVKIARKSTATDMTPFVDVAFLILAFFIMATKFKPQEPVQITTPKSVSAEQLKEENAVHVNFDPEGRVFFNITVKVPSRDGEVIQQTIQAVNQRRNLGLTNAEIAAFVKKPYIGVPFNELKAYLSAPDDQKGKYPFKGIPVDSTNNELAEWIGAAKSSFYNYDKSMQVFYMIKGDNQAKYPLFDGVLEAMRRNDQYTFKLITEPRSAPPGTALYVERNQ